MNPHNQPASAPRLSIGMAVYNGARYLEQTVNAILEQDFSDFELLISDNASTDATPAICQRLAQQDQRIRVVRQPHNRGAAFNWNYVAQAATGEYFKWASHNDLLAPRFLSQCIEVLDRHSDVVLCYPRAVLIAGDDTVLEHYAKDPAHLDESPARRFARVLDHDHLNNAHAGVMRRAALCATRGDRYYAHGDWVLMAELALRGKFWLVDEHLFHRRVGEEGSSVVRHADSQAFADFVNPERGLFTSHARTWCEQLDLLRVALTAPCPLPERLRATRAALARLPAKRRRLWRETKAVIKRGLFPRLRRSTPHLQL